MDRNDLEPLVKTGAKLLDKRLPDWFKRFDDEVLQNFNIRDEYHDVLGSLFGSFHQGLDSLFQGYCWTDKFEAAMMHGFDMGNLTLEVYDWDWDYWADLESLWREAIIDRQENGVPDE